MLTLLPFAAGLVGLALGCGYSFAQEPAPIHFGEPIRYVPIVGGCAGAFFVGEMLRRVIYHNR